jgi:hypothetical protein
MKAGSGGGHLYPLRRDSGLIAEGSCFKEAAIAAVLKPTPAKPEC